jgi:hypothetical protein
MRVKVDSTLVAQPMGKSEELIKGGDLACVQTYTAYPFVSLQRPIDRAVVIMFVDIDMVSKVRWAHAYGVDTDVDGYTMRKWAGKFTDKAFAAEAAKRGWKLANSYVCVGFRSVINPQRIMVIYYIEAGSTTNLDALEVEKRARKAFHIER